MAEGRRREQFVERLRERRERHRERHRLIRVAAVIFGFIVLLAGAVMAVPLVPGPGLLVMAVGLGILALEFAWAERLLERAADKLEDIGEVVQRRSRFQQALLAVAFTLGGIALIGAAIAWDLPWLPV
jgi:uncharacterized protein (TIGR02611 family)